MLYKNLPEEELRSVMRMRWWLDYVAALKFLLLERNWGDFKAVYKARRDFKKRLPEYKSVREKIQSTVISHDIKERSSFSILWQYYVIGRKKYSELIF